jgi:hypothetical protein
MTRLPLLGLAMVSLACGVWGGLIRLPLALPFPTENANWISFHGPLMACGFLGTLIGLERAVGLRAWWTYAAPLLTGGGALLLIAGVLGKKGPVLITVGSAVFVAVMSKVVLMQRATFTLTMLAGAVTWLVGNLFWCGDWAFNRVVLWWMAFLLLTILGERLDLTRFQRPVPAAQPLLLAALSMFLSGALLAVFRQTEGERLAGAGLLALALWLGRFDIARRTVRQAGLTRFIAVCLLTGYCWLAIAGGLLFWFAPLESGLKYDAPLHAFFLGFVFAMIFGHAPVIFPAVLHLPINFQGGFYVHLLLLHAALLLRVGADLTGWWPGRQWGGVLNSVALALFLANTLAGLLRLRKPASPA